MAAIEGLPRRSAKRENGLARRSAKREGGAEKGRCRDGAAPFLLVKMIQIPVFHPESWIVRPSKHVIDHSLAAV
jgi:hypothetical protein